MAAALVNICISLVGADMSLVGIVQSLLIGIGTLIILILIVFLYHIVITPSRIHHEQEEKIKWLTNEVCGISDDWPLTNVIDYVKEHTAFGNGKHNDEILSEILRYGAEYRLTIKGYCKSQCSKVNKYQDSIPAYVLSSYEFEKEYGDWGYPAIIEKREGYNKPKMHSLDELSYMQGPLIYYHPEVNIEQIKTLFPVNPPQLTGN